MIYNNNKLPSAIGLPGRQPLQFVLLCKRVAGASAPTVYVALQPGCRHLQNELIYKPIFNAFLILQVNVGKHLNAVYQILYLRLVTEYTLFKSDPQNMV